MVETHARSIRDLRLDFFRGISLYMILVDHVVGDPIARLTYQNLGFSDAAEAFIFLSGLSCGIVYSRVLMRRGWAGLTIAISKRAAQIYAYYVLSSIAVILILNSIKNTIVSNHPFIVLREEPISAILSTIFLTSPPDLPGILVIYLELTVVAIPLFLLGAEASAGLILTASGLVWVMSQVYPNLLPQLADHSYFNPLAWQFLFLIGMFVGRRYNSTSKGRGTMEPSRWLLTVAWAVAIFGLLYRYRVQLHLDWLPVPVVTNDKDNLSAARLLHFLSVAYLCATYIKSNSRILGWWPATVAIRTGQCSLEMFSMGAIFSVLLSLNVVLQHPGRLEKVAFDIVAVLLMALTAVVLMRNRRRYRQAITAACPNWSTEFPQERQSRTLSSTIVARSNQDLN
jgi:hypothetical protein